MAEPIIWASIRVGQSAALIKVIRNMDIRSVNLNLLVSFEALITERSVTRAAARLDVSQPAMSSALAKLRDVFQDPLLVRTSHGMAPTARALDLAEPIRMLLREIDTVLQMTGVFEPTTSRRTFRLQGTDYVESVLLPPLMEQIRGVGRDIKVIYRPPDPKHLAQSLEDGELDMGIGYIPAPGPRLRTRLVFRDRFVCIARRDHPALQGALTLAQFADLPHVQVLPQDSEMYATTLDEALSTQNIVRNVVLWEPSFLNIPHMVAQSDLVSTIPLGVARRQVEFLPIQILEPPLPLPGIDVRMFWADRAMHDSGHQWLRSLISDLGQRLKFE